MKQRVIPVIVCCLFIACPALAQQTALELFKKAESLYVKGKYVESADTYDACIEAGAVNPRTYYNAACSSALAGRKGAAFRWLEESIERGWRDVSHLNNDSDLESLHSDPRWTPMVQECVAANESFLKSIEYPKLCLELLEMQETDQMVREMGHRVDGHGDEDTVHSLHGNDMYDVDARNTARMKEIVEQFGWPTKSKVGREAATAAWLLVQHADADPVFQRYCLDLMSETAAEEVSTVDVAYLTDRVLVNEGKRQLYGTQFWYQGGKLVPRPIEDEGNLEKRRQDAGMTSFAEYLRHMSGPHDH